MVAEENARLQQRLEKVAQELQECRDSKIVAGIPALNVSKVTSLDKKRSKRNEIGDQIKSRLDEVGIALNTTLTKTIKSAPSEDFVLIAIEAYEEAAVSSDIKNPGGWLNTAIKDGWIPSEKHLPQNKIERNIFNEW